jgi:predicted nucleotidyltransferase
VIDVLEAGYAELFEQVAKAGARDERVRAMWLSGSLARGTADRASDLDVLVAVSDDAHDEFATGWQDWLASITPTVIARPLPFLPGSFFSVTPQRMRLDVVVERVSQLPASFFRERTVVFDRDQLDATVPAPAPAAGPDQQRVAELVEEFFRDHGMFNVVVEREDWLLGLEALHVMRTLLYRLYVEANAPLPASGVKRWSDKLTPEQRAVLEGLPTGSASRDELIAAIDTTGCTFVREARPICARLGVPWPDALEQATVDYLRAHGLPALEGAR